MSDAYAAGIVLYNPDIERLEENIKAVSPQVKKVYCFNNGSKNVIDIKRLLERFSNICLIDSKDNLGIAAALNCIMQQANADGCEWLLTLDQDSVVSSDMIFELSKYKDKKDVMIICPQIEDIRRKNQKPVVKKQTVDSVQFCITSGSFMNVEKTLAIGGYDEYMFIGLVDNEICMRAKINGYQILRNNAIVLDHELGNLTPSRWEDFYIRLGNRFHWEWIKKLSYKREVTPLRCYYGIRNMYYLKKKYCDFVNEKQMDKKIRKNIVSNIVRGHFKICIIKALIRGYIDGYHTPVKPYTLR